MGKKGKRRKRRRPPHRPDRGLQEEAVLADAEEAPALVEAPPEMGSKAERPDEPRRRGLFGGGLGIPSPYPTLGDSLAAGAGPVGASPVILGTAFLLMLVLWGLFLAPRGIGSASLLSVMGSLPPVSLLSDGLILLQDPTGALRPFLSVIGVMVVRAVGLALLAGLVVMAIRDGRPDLRGAMSKLPRLSWRLFAILSAQLGLALGVFILLQGFLGVQFAVLFSWIMGLYFLAFAPVILVAEDLPAAEVLRRSVRAARLPGMRHLALVLAYFAFIFWVSTATLEPTVPPATPSFLTWLVVLGSTFVHVATLGILAYRWLAVRDQVPAGPAPRRRR